MVYGKLYLCHPCHLEESALETDGYTMRKTMERLGQGLLHMVSVNYNARFHQESFTSDDRSSISSCTYHSDSDEITHRTV
jgi:hypothetical protein